MTVRIPAHACLTLEPIGYMHCALRSKAEAARQPRMAKGAGGRIELLPGRNLEHALDDLAGWEYLWVIFWFHLNAAWRPKVLPPRSRSGRKGVFSTRSPHRPNPLGLSVVRLERVAGLTLQVRNVDMLDGTPVLDLKPYVAYSDALPAAASGWLEGSARAATGALAADPIPSWEVQIAALATQQAKWIEARTGLRIRERIEETLALGPEPHPYRRIRRAAERLHLAVKEWRVPCVVQDRAIRVLEICSGCRASQLAHADPLAEPFRAHREFTAAFCSAGPRAGI